MLCSVYELSLRYFLAVLFICTVFPLGFMCNEVLFPATNVRCFVLLLALSLLLLIGPYLAIHHRQQPHIAVDYWLI